MVIDCMMKPLASVAIIEGMRAPRISTTLATPAARPTASATAIPGSSPASRAPIVPIDR